MELPGKEVSISQLAPSLGTESRVVHGVVTIIWPYSPSQRTLSLLLAERDFRLRRSRGQVRVSFYGHAAKAVADADVNSGDELKLGTIGAEWLADQVPNHTPGRGIEWQLRFSHRLRLVICRDPNVVVEIDRASPTPEPEITARLDQDEVRDAQPAAVPIATMSVRTSTDSRPFPMHRFRFRDDEDPFDDEKRSKRTKFGRRSSEWRFADRSPTPTDDEMLQFPNLAPPAVTSPVPSSPETAAHVADATPQQSFTLLGAEVPFDPDIGFDTVAATNHDLFREPRASELGLEMSQQPVHDPTLDLQLPAGIEEFVEQELMNGSMPIGSTDITAQALHEEVDRHTEAAQILTAIAPFPVDSAPEAPPPNPSTTLAGISIPDTRQQSTYPEPLIPSPKVVSKLASDQEPQSDHVPPISDIQVSHELRDGAIHQTNTHAERMSPPTDAVASPAPLPPAKSAGTAAQPIEIIDLDSESEASYSSDASAPEVESQEDRSQRTSSKQIREEADYDSSGEESRVMDDSDASANSEEERESDDRESEDNGEIVSDIEEGHIPRRPSARAMSDESEGESESSAANASAAAPDTSRGQADIVHIGKDSHQLGHDLDPDEVESHRSESQSSESRVPYDSADEEESAAANHALARSLFAQEVAEQESDDDSSPIAERLDGTYDHPSHGVTQGIEETDGAHRQIGLVLISPETSAREELVPLVSTDAAVERHESPSEGQLMTPDATQLSAKAVDVPSPSSHPLETPAKTFVVSDQATRVNEGAEWPSLTEVTQHVDQEQIPTNISRTSHDHGSPDPDTAGKRESPPATSQAQQALPQNSTTNEETSAQGAHEGEVLRRNPSDPDVSAFLEQFNGPQAVQGIRTPLSYYVNLDSLGGYMHSITDFFAIVIASSRPQRARSGPRDHFLTLYLCDPWVGKKPHAHAAAQIYRPSRDALPQCSVGDAIILRNFKVQTQKGWPTLLSCESSGWAVFAHNDAVDVRGPPVEIGEQEHKLAQALRQWWAELTANETTRIEDSVALARRPGKRTAKGSAQASASSPPGGASYPGEVIHELRDGTTYSDP